MDIIKKIETELQKYPLAKYGVDGSTITVNPITETGFHIIFSSGKNEHTIFFEGWHESFADEPEAIRCFLFGLSDKCRLKVISRGGMDYKWVVQNRSNDEWIDISETCLLLFPFWRSRKERYLQNPMIKDVY